MLTSQMLLVFFLRKPQKKSSKIKESFEEKGRKIEVLITKQYRDLFSPQEVLSKFSVLNNLLFRF